MSFDILIMRHTYMGRMEIGTPMFDKIVDILTTIVTYVIVFILALAIVFALGLMYRNAKEKIRIINYIRTQYQTEEDKRGEQNGY